MHAPSFFYLKTLAWILLTFFRLSTRLFNRPQNQVQRSPQKCSKVIDPRAISKLKASESGLTRKNALFWITFFLIDPWSWCICRAVGLGSISSYKNNKIYFSLYFLKVKLVIFIYYTMQNKRLMCVTVLQLILFCLHRLFL